jgi:hypothetical protein
MKAEKHVINELGKFIFNDKDGFYSGNVESEIMGTINLMYPSENKGISKYQINSFRNIEKEWKNIKSKVTQNLQKSILMENCRIDAILIPHEGSHNYNYDIELVYSLKKSFFSRRYICFSALLKKWELDEIIYL